MSLDLLYVVTTVKVIKILNEFQQISIKTISSKIMLYFFSKIPNVIMFLYCTTRQEEWLSRFPPCPVARLEGYSYLLKEYSSPGIIHLLAHACHWPIETFLRRSQSVDTFTDEYKTVQRPKVFWCQVKVQWCNSYSEHNAR